MSKKFLIALLALVFAVCCAFGLAACDDKTTDDSGNTGNSGNSGNTDNSGNTGSGENTGSTGNTGDNSTQGLMYTLSDDGTYYICSYLEKSAENVIIASQYEGLPVKEIAYNTFERNKDIVSVVIPDSVTQIGAGAFGFCSNLKSVTFPKGITEISDGLFYGCESLSGVTIPDGVTKIGDSAFNRCKKLTSITVPDSVVEICGSAFFGCDRLSSLKLGKGLKIIQDRVFCYTPIKDAVIPDGVTEIGEHAFSHCEKLESITLPASLTYLGDFMFDGCMAFKSVTYKATKAEWENIFNCYWGDNMGDYIVHCTDGDVGEIDDGSQDVDENATAGLEFTRLFNEEFYRCSGLGKVTERDIVISSTYKGLPVTGIEYGAFEGTNITSVVIPDSVTEIDEQAFSGCSSLRKITLPNSVTKIGEYAFAGTAYYDNNSNWKSGVLYIGNHLISARSEVSGEYAVRQATVTIAARAFDGCNRITKITLPDSVKSICDYAFYQCYSLTSINVPDGVTTIGEWAFYNCNNLKSIIIPDGITKISGNAFYKCYNLTNVTIPASVTVIRTNAFMECADLTNITFNGTKAQWDEIDKWSGWDDDTGEYVVTCTDGIFGEAES